MRTVGRWTLRHLLGRGGNGQVWLAESSGQEVALKVLRQSHGERYHRFRDEAALLRSLGDRAGILPLIDCYLPENPTRADPAWLAMPVAKSLKEHLADSSLTAVVSAVKGIAGTLATLVEDGIGHRDVKPANLYWHKDAPVIGDFGLAHFPGKESVTVEGKKLGPLHFLAPEMLSDPLNALPHPADVYSLAKSLWVLVTGQSFPPPGEQRRDTPAVLLSTYVAHPRSHLLDALIEDATRHDPSLRPDMATFAADLSSWLVAPPPGTVGPEVADLGRRVSTIMERDRMRQEEEHRPRVHAALLNQRFFEKATSVGERLEESGFPVEQVTTTTLWDIHGKGSLLDHGPLVHLGANMYRVQGGPLSPQLLSGVGVELYEDGTLHLAAAHIVIPFGSVVGARISWIGSRELPLQAHAQQDQAIGELASGLLNSLRPATEVFTELFEASRVPRPV